MEDLIAEINRENTRANRRSVEEAERRSCMQNRALSLEEIVQDLGQQFERLEKNSKETHDKLMGMISQTEFRESRALERLKRLERLENRLDAKENERLALGGQYYQVGDIISLHYEGKFYKNVMITAIDNNPGPYYFRNFTIKTQKNYGEKKNIYTNRTLNIKPKDNFNKKLLIIYMMFLLIIILINLASYLGLFEKLREMWF